jgi:hypothetical protein
LIFLGTLSAFILNRARLTQTSLLAVLSMLYYKLANLYLQFFLLSYLAGFTTTQLSQILPMINAVLMPILP